MKPILFNTDMVRAILDGRKTVTRRVIKPQPKGMLAYCCMGCNIGKWGYPSKDAWKYWENEAYILPKNLTDDDLKRNWTPPCNTGDILYVRETWARGYFESSDSEYDSETWFEENYGMPHGPYIEGITSYFYRADFSEQEEIDLHMIWRPSIHMPKEAARIFLRVKKVSVEELQWCGCLDAKEEGCTCCSQFIRLWDSTIKKSDLDRYGWGANPWVWVIEFERVSREDVQHG